MIEKGKDYLAQQILRGNKWCWLMENKFLEEKHVTESMKDDMDAYLESKNKKVQDVSKDKPKPDKKGVKDNVK